MPSRPSLRAVLQQQFPTASIPEANPEAEPLAVGCFAEWTSLGHFNFLMLVEETFDVRFSVEEMTELKSLDQILAALQARGVEAP